MNATIMETVRQLFAAHGVTEEPVRLSGGWTNHVFAAGGLVLRCTQDVQSGRLAREAALARLLPAHTCYPELLCSGCTDGLVWMLCIRIPGTNLEDAWGALTWDERADALEQLWARVRRVHQLDADAVRPFVNARLWYFTSVDAAQAEADLLRRRSLLTPEQHAAVHVLLHRFDAGLQHTRPVPVHGDLTPANAMWHNGAIAALMDFECAAIAPREADLMMLLNTAFERTDLLSPAPDAAGEQRFRARMRTLVQAERPDWDVLRGYQAIKLMHHVAMDMDDDDFSPEHEELLCLTALLKDGRGMINLP